MAVNVVLILDISDSMRTYGYFKDARLDASAFISLMNEGDFLAVKAIDTRPKDVWPSPMKLQELLSTHHEDAQNAVLALQTDGATDIKGPLDQAQTLLASVSKRGVVMLSDGEYNRGGNPIPVKSSKIPVYTIALGNHGQINTLKQISKDTKGVFKQTPDQFALYKIYLEIAGQSLSQAVTAVALEQNITTGSVKFKTASVPAGQKELTYTAAWTDPSVKFSQTTPPPTGTINIALQQPDSSTYPHAPDFSHPGYVTYKIPNPQTGTYTMSCWYDGPKEKFDCTMGLLEPGSPVTLEVQPRAEEVRCGRPLRVKANILDGDEQVPHVKIKAQLERPTRTKAEVRREYKAELAAIVPDPRIIADGVAEEDARLIQLAEDKRPEIDIWRRKTTWLKPRRDDAGTHQFRYRTRAKGIHGLTIVAEGFSQRRKLFTRQRYLTINVV